MSDVIVINYANRKAEFKATHDMPAIFFHHNGWNDEGIAKAQRVVDMHNKHIRRAHELMDEAYNLNARGELDASNSKYRAAQAHRRRAAKYITRTN